MPIFFRYRSATSPRGSERFDLPLSCNDRLNQAINRAISSPSFLERFKSIGDDPGGGTPEEFGALIKSELAKWAEVIKRSGAKID